ncbi:MAG: hypothetical protein ACUVUF_05030 [Candidatus Bathycorpusculaceae bacterium]
MLKRVETMSVSEKILKSMQTVMAHFNNLTDALSRGDENFLADSLWHLAAELEYMIFLFSMTIQGESESARWKPNPEVKSMEIESILTNVKRLLNDAEKFFAQGNLREAYRSAYVARHYALKIQENLAKKKREAFKRKQK